MGEDTKLAPKALSKTEFARRLYQLMADRGWNQSDLCRAAFGTNPETGDVRGRDIVSKYINGRTYPTPKSVAKLAKAFGITPDELLPNYVKEGMAEEAPSFEVRQVAGDPHRVWLTINRSCSPKTAGKIFDLLNREDDPDDA